MKRTQKIKQQLEALVQNESDRAANPELYAELLNADVTASPLTADAVKDFSYLEDDSDAGYSLIFLTSNAEAAQSFIKTLRSGVNVNIKQIIKDGPSWDMACFGNAILVKERFMFSFGAGAANEAVVLNRTGFPDATLQLLGGSLIKGYLATLSDDVTVNHSYWLTHDASDNTIEATANGETAPSPVAAVPEASESEQSTQSPEGESSAQIAAPQQNSMKDQSKNNVKPKDGGAPGPHTSQNGDITIDEILNW